MKHKMGMQQYSNMGYSQNYPYKLNEGAQQNLQEQMNTQMTQYQNQNQNHQGQP
jgi:hypothetical protein